MDKRALRTDSTKLPVTETFMLVIGPLRHSNLGPFFGRRSSSPDIATLNGHRTFGMQVELR